MKVSNYNFFIPYKDNKVIAYNSFTNALGLLERKDYVEFKKNQKNIDSLNDFKLIEELRKGGFIIEDEINELEIIRTRMYRDRFNDDMLGLTIVPTADCNFRCIYCYEKNSIRKEKMSKDTMDKIIDFVNNKSSSLKHLSITWYGGEPLLALAEIEYMSKKFFDICKKNNISYSAGIVTNGYLLTIKNLKKLKELKINDIQITIDGDKESHNKRRCLENGSGTFDKIIENIDKGKELLPPTSLRINVDKSNYKNIYGLLNLLMKKGLNKYVYPYLGHVKNGNDTYDYDICLSIEDFSKLVIEFDRLIKNTPNHNYPVLKTVSCTADRFNSFVIDVDGTLYRCWDDVGMSELKTGNINNLNLNKEFTKYLTMDATLDDNCSKCKFLAICMGSCPKNFYNKNRNCSKYKYILYDFLSYYVDYYNNKVVKI